MPSVFVRRRRRRRCGCYRLIIDYQLPSVIFYHSSQKAAIVAVVSRARMYSTCSCSSDLTASLQVDTPPCCLLLPGSTARVSLITACQLPTAVTCASTRTAEIRGSFAGWVQGGGTLHKTVAPLRYIRKMSAIDFNLPTLCSVSTHTQL